MVSACSYTDQISLDFLCIFIVSVFNISLLHYNKKKLLQFLL